MAKAGPAYERSVFLPDIHVPFHDEKAVSCALAFIRHYKPQAVFQLGDLADFYAISRFSRDPERRARFMEEIHACRKMLERIREAAGGEALFYYIQGNHEYRLTRYLWDKAAELHGIDALDITNLLQLHHERIRAKYMAAGRMIHQRGNKRAGNPTLIVKHGDYVRKRAGYSATAEIDDAWVSGISGHTHRMAMVGRRNEAGLFSWTEAGCLCDLNPEYMEGKTADWHQAIAYGTHETPGSRFEIQLAPIIKGKIIYGGVEISG
jgi:predicted phosphodiesterase